MIQLVLALVLLAAFNGEGLQTPVPLASSLLALASSCKNPFLVNQIKSKISNCNVTVPPYYELQLQCLMFYDINSQLCDVVAASKMALLDVHSVSINDTLDLKVLCTESKQWEVVDLPNYPQFKPTVEKVFKNMITCVKMCGTTDAISEDSNFYCKYFRWGLSTLNATNKAVATSPEVTEATPIHEAVKVPALSNAAVQSQAELEQAVKPVLDHSSSSINDPSTASKNNIVKPPNEIITKLQTPKTPVEMVPNPQVSESIQSNPDQDPNLVKDQAEEPKEQTRMKATGQMSSSAVQLKPLLPEEVDNDNTGEVGMQTPVPAVMPSAAVTPKPKKQKKVKPPVAVLPQAAENDSKLNSAIKPEGEVEDYEGGEDDADDPMNDLDKPEQSQAEVAVNKYNKLADSFRDRETYPSTLQDVYSDGSDNFFPLFSSCILLVVLLYVLYHNKNKVSKVILGLIVEGRSGARGRRGSRGHAYRRLDTLEHAMSAPTANAPEKIIY